MSANSKIEWCDHTQNFWEGCQPAGPGCDRCYAEARNKRFNGGVAINWGPGAPRRRTSEANWRKPLAWNARHEAFFSEHGRRQRVFCSSLADVFDNAVDPQWRDDMWQVIWDTPNLDWLLLTKRIGNVLAMLPEEWGNGMIDHWPHVWIGATICNQAEADRDIPKLLEVPAAKRFLSMEPLLGPVDFDASMFNTTGLAEGQPYLAPLRGFVYDGHGDTCSVPAIDWVIVGGESGPGARPMHPDWARSLRDQCEAARVPFLFKQWGNWIPSSSGDFCRSATRPEHAEFRAKHGRGGYEFAGKEGKAIIRNGQTCLSQQGGTIWHRPAPDVVDIAALEQFKKYVRSGNDDPGYQWMFDIGKKAAGRLLDGREWNGFPS